MTDKKVLFAESMLMIITIIWGLGFPITKIAISYGFEAHTIMSGRFFIAAIVLYGVYNKRFHHINKDMIIMGSITGVFLFLGFYFQTLGNVFTTSSKNGFITQLNIVFVPYLYYLFFKRKVDLYNIVAVFIAIIGMFVLSYNSNGFKGINIGDLYTLICAVMVAFHIVTASYFQKKYDFDPALFVFTNIVTAMVLSISSMLLFETFPQIETIQIWPIIFLGVFNTALGFLVQSYALKISIPTRISLIVTMESIFAAISSILIIGEVLDIKVVVGGFLIVIAVVVNELKPFKQRRILEE